MNKLSAVFMMISAIVGYILSIHLGLTREIPPFAMFGYAMINVCAFVYGGFQLYEPTIDKRIR